MPQYWLPPISIVLNQPAGPGPNTPYDLTIPDNYIYMLAAANFILTTDGTVTDRYPNIGITDGTLDLARQYANKQQGASNVNSYTAIQGQATISSQPLSGYYFMSLPQNLYLIPGYHVLINVDAMQAGDTLTNITLTFLSWTSPQST